MAKGNKIVATGFPKGNFQSCIISGTPKPGTAMTIKATSSLTSGVPTMEAYNPTADNDPRAIAILCEDEVGGVAPTGTYTNGSMGVVYFPVPGDDLNILVAGQPGTGNANVLTIGERFSPVHGTGKFTPQATSGNRAPFQSIEAVTEPINVDALVCCRYGSF